MSKIELREDKKTTGKQEAVGPSSTSPAAKHSAALSNLQPHKPSLAYLRANQRTANQILNTDQTKIGAS